MNNEKKRRNSVKINLNEYPKELRGIIINKLYGNQTYLPDNNYLENKSVHKNSNSVFHVTPLMPDNNGK